MLLRDPIRLVWRYGLGWKAPEDADEPLTLDPNDFGMLVHALLQEPLSALRPTAAWPTLTSIGSRLHLPLRATGPSRSWEDAQSVPPEVIWGSTTARGHELAAAALAYVWLSRARGRKPPLDGEALAVADLCNRLVGSLQVRDQTPR
jgi:hypothetical protein